MEYRSFFNGNVRGGPSLWFVTSKDDPETSQDDIELFTVYHAQVGYEYRAFSLSGGVTGRMLVTTDADFDARSFHQLGFAANTQVGRSLLGLQFKLPLDEGLKDIYAFVLGLHLGWQFD